MTEHKNTVPTHPDIVWLIQNGRIAFLADIPRFLSALRAVFDLPYDGDHVIRKNLAIRKAATVIQELSENR